MTRQIRLAVTGLSGQLARTLYSSAPKDFTVIPMCRPIFDLELKESILSSIIASNCDIIVSAAAYTAVDNAEREPDLAMKINCDGVGYVAEAASALKIPIIHLSTDYVFDGALNRPYREDDPTSPMSEYGRSKLEGELKLCQVNPNHVILRTAWVYSVYGHNFLKTMLYLGETKDVVRVVDDQIGNPTYAFDIAEGIFKIARRLNEDHSCELRGVFNMVGDGHASWASFANCIYENARNYGFRQVKVLPIKTVDYPTLARRPANSRLDTYKIRRIYGIKCPNWRESTMNCVNLIMKNNGY